MLISIWFDRDFHQFLESLKKLKKKSRSAKLSKKCHEKVNTLQAKQFLIFKTWVINQSGNYLRPLELVFPKKSLSQKGSSLEFVESVHVECAASKTPMVHIDRRLFLNWHQLLVSPITLDYWLFLKKQALEALDNYLIG